VEHRSVVEYLDHFLQRGHETAYVQRRGYRTVRWSYRQVADLAFQFARELDARAITKGERVLLWGPNSTEWVAAFLGCAIRGVVVVPMDDVATPDFALRVHQQVDARLLVCSREHAQQSIPTLPLEDFPEALRSRSTAAYPSATIEPADTLEIVFTSGTTAEPKGVVITHGNVLANIGTPRPLLEPVATQSCLRTISWHLPSATDGRHRDFPGNIQTC
jgi:long-chain acyl-CoA synthetase